MRAARLAGAAALAAVAVLAVLLARDVGAWKRSFAQGDAVYAATPGRATWTPGASLGGLSQSLLGTDDDVAIRRGLQLYAVAAATPRRLDTAVELQSLRARAQTLLAGAAHGRNASLADALLGVLAFSGQSGADAAIADFTDAVRADPTNAAAAFDLELLLRSTEAQGSRPGSGTGGTFGRGGRRGAGNGAPGSGY
jgi:hypothetical protein